MKRSPWGALPVALVAFRVSMLVREDGAMAGLLRVTKLFVAGRAFKVSPPVEERAKVRERLR